MANELIENPVMKVRAITPWFGGKRTLAPKIVELLGKHTQYFEPFCGSMAVLLAKEKSQKETVNDLHGDLNNLARVIADPDQAPKLYLRLMATPMAEELLEQAKYELAEMTAVPESGVTAAMLDRAYWYFIASWMGRNGTAGTARVDYQIAVRWTKNGGSPTVRFQNAVDSLPAWHRRLLNVVILRRDAFKILDRFEDVPQTAIYCDPPYMIDTRSKGRTKNGGGGHYLHEFEHTSGLYDRDDHACMAEILRGYRSARIVVSYYDSPKIRELYEGWNFHCHKMNKQLHAQNGRGARKKEAPEVLICNF
ncbi:DNA adenine methylase [Rubinisphaera italica]|uniref:DNA adenine methylase n=1 Tax=Rubinisphaera italica TaxID=2527969 RepID=A0A5C5XJ20_9PLAN|nr:DNA adenine methylase [Rubinisphaera italica]TWT63167.1 DNA adenine methylase [Rubinisphaera italica]